MRARLTRQAALALAAGALGVGVGAIAVSGAPVATAQGYIPCEQWQAMHPGWPCIDTPTMPPVPPGGPPTVSTPPPLPSQTPGLPSQQGSGGGIGAGALTPPPIPPGNGTPIVPVPGAETPVLPGNQPPAPPAPKAVVPQPPPPPPTPPVEPVPAPGSTTEVPSVELPAPATVAPLPPPVIADSAVTAQYPPEYPDGRIPVLLLAGAAAFLAPAVRSRSGGVALSGRVPAAAPISANSPTTAPASAPSGLPSSPTVDFPLRRVPAGRPPGEYWTNLAPGEPLAWGPGPGDVNLIPDSRIWQQIVWTLNQEGSTSGHINITNTFLDPASNPGSTVYEYRQPQVFVNGRQLSQSEIRQGQNPTNGPGSYDIEFPATASDNISVYQAIYATHPGPDGKPVTDTATIEFNGTPLPLSSLKRLPPSLKPTPGWLEGESEILVWNPDSPAEPITDIDYIRDGVLWEEKSIMAMHPDDMDRWSKKEMDRKVDKYLEARQFIPYYNNAPIGFRFTNPNMDQRTKDLMIAKVEQLRQEHPGVVIRMEFAA